MSLGYSASWRNPWSSLLWSISRASIAAAEDRAYNNSPYITVEWIWLCWSSLLLRIQNITSGWGIRGSFFITCVFPLKKTGKDPALRERWRDTSPQDLSSNLPLLVFMVVTKGNPSKQRGRMERTRGTSLLTLSLMSFFFLMYLFLAMRFEPFLAVEAIMSCMIPASHFISLCFRVCVSKIRIIMMLTLQRIKWANVRERLIKGRTQ